MKTSTAPKILRRCSGVQRVFDDLKPNLSLCSLPTNALSPEHIETAVLMLGGYSFHIVHVWLDDEGAVA